MVNVDLYRKLYGSIKSIFLHIDNQEKEFLSKFDLTITRFYILTHVNNNPGINYIDLSELLLCTKGNTTRIVSAMQSEGLLVRRINPGDRRSYHLYLTERGEDLFEEVHGEYLGYINGLMSQFNEDKLNTYAKISMQIEEVLESSQIHPGN